MEVVLEGLAEKLHGAVPPLAVDQSPREKRDLPEHVSVPPQRDFAARSPVHEVEREARQPAARCLAQVIDRVEGGLHVARMRGPACSRQNAGAVRALHGGPA
jgi:hypothetical protein